MSKIRNSYQVFDDYQMNNKISFYPEDDVNITLSSNLDILTQALLLNENIALPSNFRHFNSSFTNYYMNNEISYRPKDNMDIGILPVVGYVNRAEYENEGGDDSENRTRNVESNIYKGDNSENRTEDYIYKGDDSESEPEDSPLKEIYTGQTFTSFVLLEQYLKRYSIRMGFETKIVKVEKDDNVCIKKIYKCRHGGKYLPKKKLDPTTNREQESACIECGFALNASYQKCSNRVFVNKFIEEHNHELKDKIYDRDLYNMISRFKTNTQNKNDALTLYESLVRLQQENPDWYFKMDLMNKYPEIQGYCNRVLYPTKEYWAHAFTKRKFSANTYSTQHVESINCVIKLEANSGNSLCQLQLGIELQLKDETKYARDIDNMYKEYFTLNSLALQRRQILESLLYRSLIRANEKSDCHNVGFIEDDYKELQILLNMALKDCCGTSVNEIWKVRHIQSTTNYSQFVLLLEDGTHYCTCLYLIYAGFVCRHFFAVIMQSKKALFNMKLIPSWWYSEKGLMASDNQGSSVQVVQNKGEPLPTSTFQVLQKIRGQEIDVRNAVELDLKKVSYSHSLGLCKKALNIAITNGSNKALEDILQQFIDEQVLAQNENSSEQELN
ncbi:8542_t:CDS:2 [Gigaspora margarita]|uniref:8542_t:CDS:1 n=1 Tax=Gigaspora margarita TaxID=4874 RepID=A0ABN7UKL0_GIGMA|nr:8542_t:CDS:2 [Gigaspora margarita]